MTAPPSSPEARADRVARTAWPWMLGAFVLAASTGAFLRFSALTGLPPGLTYGDVRHAHSHLMYFGWVTPAWMAFGAVALARAGIVLPGLRILVVGALVAAFASYPAFLASGYRSASWLGLELPWSMLTAGLNGITWLAFIVSYLVASVRRSSRAEARQHAMTAWFDAGIWLLAASLLAIAGLAATGVTGLADPRVTGALVDLFLALFGEGWFTAAALALAVSAVAETPAGIPRRVPGALGVAVLAFAIGMTLRSAAIAAVAIAPGAELAFPLANFVGPGGFGPVVSVGHLLVGLAIVATIPILFWWRAHDEGGSPLWIAALGFLLLKGVVEVAMVSPAFRDALAALNLRVLLLHAFLLGGISIAVVAASRPEHRAGASLAASPAAWGFAIAVFGLLAGLLPLTGLWPAGARGAWALHLAAWTSLGPVIAALALLAASLRRMRDSRAA